MPAVRSASCNEFHRLPSRIVMCEGPALTVGEEGRQKPHTSKTWHLNG